MTTPSTETATTTIDTGMCTDQAAGKGVHAILKNTMGDIITVTATTRTGLAKELQKHPDYDIIRVYKGRELAVKKKASYSFN